jgi:hypothetical protein
MRIEAAQAIYNCAIRDKTILSKERIKNMQECLKDPDVKFQAVITKILCLIDNDDIDVRILLNSSLSQL